MELEEFLESNEFTKLRSMDNVNHLVYGRQHTLVSIWNNSVSVTAYGRVNFSGGKENTLNYLQGLKEKGVNH